MTGDGEKPAEISLCGLAAAAVLPSGVMWEGLNTKPFR